MHDFVPAPVFAPVTVRADLEQTNQGPSRPHEDTVDIVLQIVTFAFLKRAGSVSSKCLNKLHIVFFMVRHVGIVGVPGHDQVQGCI